MGREVCLAVIADEDTELVGVVDVSADGDAAPFEQSPVAVNGVESLDIDELDVLVDFTNAAAAVRNMRWAASHGIHCVVGTTGIAAAELEEIAAVAAGKGANLIVAANFALGAVLMMKFSETAARVFDQCEIIEMHHRGKLDAPSGTALQTADRVGKAMSPAEVPGSREKEVTGSRGGNLGPVNIHSVRLDGLVAHQQVIFGSQGETLTIRHDTTDRTSFMPGVMLAVKSVGETPGLTTGIEGILGLE